jgi:RHS repeat-associated protein
VNWTDPNNWSTHAVPGAADDVTINIQSNSYLHIASGVQSIHSLVCDDKLIVFSGATLQVATTASFDTNSAEDYVLRGLDLAGGTLLGGTYSFNGNSSTTLNAYSAASTLSGVTIAQGSVICNIQNQNASITIQNGLILNGSLNIEAGGVVNFGDSTHAAGTLSGSGQVNFNGTYASLVNASGLGGASGTFTIASTISLYFAQGSIYNSATSGSIINNGQIFPFPGYSPVQAQLGSTTGTFTNATSFELDAGTLTLGNFINDAGAVITDTGPSSPASTLTFTGSLDNEGTINVTNIAVTLAGDISQANLGTLNRSSGTVTLTGTLEGNLNLDASTGSWNISGTLNGGTVTESDGSTANITNTGGGTANGGILNGVTINGDLNLTLEANAYVYVEHSLTVTGTITLGNTAGTTSAAIFLGTGGIGLNTKAPFIVTGAVSLSAGSIVFGASSGDAIFDNTLVEISKPGPNDPPAVTSYNDGVTTHYYGGGPVTIAGSIQGTRGTISDFYSRSTIAVSGPVTASGSGSLLVLGGTYDVGVVQNYLTNTGTMDANNGGELLLSGLVNKGSVTAESGSLLEFSDTISNLGTITATNSTVNLNGTFAQGDLGVFNRPGSTVLLSGTLNGGANFNSSTGSWFMYGGIINGGTITESGGAELTFTNYGGKFENGVTVDGDMDMDGGSPAGGFGFEAELTVYSGLTLNGTMYLGNVGNTAYAEVTFGDNAHLPGAIMGNGTIDFGSSISDGGTIYDNGNGSYTQSLVFGPGITIRGKGGTISSIYSPVIIEGTVNDDTAGGNFQLSAPMVLNYGVIESTNGGAVTISNLINEPGATLSSTSSTLTLSGSLSNQGVFSSNGSTVNLGASFVQANLGNFSRTGGTVNLTGILTGGLALNALTGSWVLSGGTIQNGAVNLSGGAELMIIAGTLRGVTVNGNIDAAEAQEGSINIFGGLVLNGTMSLAGGAALYFGTYNQPAGSLTGNATIDFEGYDWIYNASGLANQTLTIGPAVTIHGAGGVIEVSYATSTILIEGAINSDVTGGTIQLGNGAGAFIETGAITADGGQVTIDSPLNLNGQGTLNGNWTGSIHVSSTGTLTGNTTATNGSTFAGGAYFSGSGNPQLLEVMSQDEGATAAGFKNNFAYGYIEVDTSLKLVDNADNAPGSAPEALYVNSLLVNTFEQLDLNGIHVYARAVQINGAASVINGTITVLPDGGPLDINSPLPGAISPTGNVDNWTFFGHAGQVITTYVNAGTGTAPAPLSPNLNWARVQLLDPNNQLLASGESGGPGAAVSLANVTLPSDGIYTIQISAPADHSSSTGDYDVAVFDVTPRVAPLLLSQNTAGSINTAFDVQKWTFAALAGEQVKFHINNQTSQNLLYTLTGPNGFTGFSNITTDSGLINLPANGVYTLTVAGSNGATGNYSFVINATTQTTVPLNGSVNSTLAGPGQAELFAINVPSVQALVVQLNDSSPTDSNELYLSFGTPPTPQNYDYRYSLADSASQSILVPRAAIGTWYALIYSDYVPAPSSITISATGYAIHVATITPNASGNSASATVEITGAGFEPGTTATLIGSGGTHYAATNTSVVSYTELLATFPAGLPAGTYSVLATSGPATDTLSGAFTLTAGGVAHLETSLQVPNYLGRHMPATIYITYGNTGTVAMPAPLLELGSTDPQQVPLMTLDASKITQGVWTATIPEGYSTTLQILASGAIPGVLEPGESITVPVYYAGLLQPWNTADTSVPLNLGVIDTSDSETVDWNSLKATLQPSGVPNAAWNQIYSNLTSQLGSTWGQFVSALDNNAAYLGSLGENVTDFNTLWGFMYAQANDSVGPLDHLQTVFDAALSLPNGGNLSFWRNYHLDINDRYAVGMFGIGWSVPYQSSLQIETSGDAVLHTVGEGDETFQADTRGGYFNSDDGNSLAANSDGTYTITGTDGESDTYSGTGTLLYHADGQGDRINFGYDGSGRLISLTASTGQSITLTYNAAGLVSTLASSDGGVVTYGYDVTNQYLTTVTSIEGTTTYSYNKTSNELTGIQNADGSYTNLTYDATGRLLTLASQTTSLTLSYEEPGEISGTDALGHVSHQFYNEMGQVIKSIDALGNPTYFTYDANGDVTTITDAVGDTFTYKYDSSGNLTSFTDPLGHTTELTYTAQGDLASYTDANDNLTSLSYGAAGVLSTITYPDGTQESFALNNLDETTSLVQRNGEAIDYSYDGNGNITQENFADGTQYNYSYDAYGDLLTATDSGGTTTFTYNAQGAMTSVTYPDGTSLTYTYNAAGQLVKRVDQSGYTLNYVYDAAGRPIQLVDGSNQPISTYTYDAGGNLVRQDNANGTYTTYQYDADGNITHLINYAPGGAVNSRFDCTYNLLNQLTSETTLDGVWDYTYDAAGQLTRAIFTSSNPNIPNQDLAYNYDPVGNRISTIINGVTTNYTVNAMNEYTSIGGVAQAYDADGNLISDGSTTYTYNALNQLTGFSNAQGSSQFTYNALGERINSTINGVFTEFLNDPNGTGTPTAEYNSAGQLITHINLGQGLASQTTAAGANYFYDADPTGSIVGLTNSSGAYVDQYRYLPFGTLLSSSGSVANPFEFAGSEMVQADAPNLYSMGLREYSATTGSFMSTDPLQIAGGNWDLYTYAYNQPLQLVDPSGLKALSPTQGQPWTIAHGIPIIPPQTIYNAMGGASAFKTDSFPEEPPSDFDAAKEAGGPLTETIEDALHTIVYEQRLPTGDEILDNLQDHAFDALNKGPLAVFQVGTILKMLCDPVMAVNIGNGILGVERSQLCGTINGYEAAALVAIGEATAGCENAPGVFGPVAPVGTGVTAHSSIASAFDPNDKIGPSGFGTPNFVTDTGNFSYRIDFENDPSATAPAQEVIITDQLSSSLNWSTFRITAIGFGNTVISVPGNEQQYQTTVPITYDGVAFEVLAKVGINLGTGLITAEFFSIDPNTQLPPPVLIGFLPPEDGTGRGMGYINYTVSPKAGLPTGTQIRNVANVSFDQQEIVATDQVSDDDPTQGVSTSKQALVTIDSVAPTSSVIALPAIESSASFLISWSGQDDAGGSGIAAYTIYVSDNGGAYAPWLSDTTQTSQTFTGSLGHSYAFYSVATDNAGNIETAPASADATTSIHTGNDIVSAQFANSGALQLSVQYSDPITPSTADAQITPTGGSAINASSVSYNSSTNIAVYSFASAISSGFYHVQVQPAGQTDSYGNPTSISRDLLFVQNFASYALAGTGQTYTVEQLLMGTDSKLDLGNNTLLVDYSTGNDPAAAVGAMIQLGYANGQWNGPGIFSSTVAADTTGTTGVGCFDNGSQIKLERTWYGDANLDSQINADDLSLMMLGQIQGGTRWQDGNYNYDAQVNADDWIKLMYALAYSNGQALPADIVSNTSARVVNSALYAVSASANSASISAFAQTPISVGDELSELLESPQ